MQWNTPLFLCFVLWTASISNAQQQSSVPQLKRTVLNVVTIYHHPFVSWSTESCEGNACFKGYAIDLLKELSKILGFEYRIKLSDDRRYGSKSINGTWNGMIGEVADGRADLAVGGLAITNKRQEAVDFSYPFMTTGLGILYRKSFDPQEYKLKSPTAVWFYCLITFIMITLFMMKRRRSSQTKDNLICGEFGSVACTTKSFIYSWKLFTFLMVTLSFGTVAMFIFCTQSLFVTQFRKVEELSMQSQIRYGTTASGLTRIFFQQSTVPTYAKLWKGMSSDPRNFLTSTRGNIEGVKQGNYAFFMNALAAKYIIERDYDLVDVGDLLDFQAYGIAMKKGSYLKKLIDVAILQMQESGVLDILKNRWWKSMFQDVSKPYSHQYQKETPIEFEAFSLVGYAAGFSGVLLLLCACIELLYFFWQKFFEVKR